MSVMNIIRFNSVTLKDLSTNYWFHIGNTWDLKLST
jgi:hypothetical protein